MQHRTIQALICVCLALAYIPGAIAEWKKPEVKTWTKQEKNDKGEMEDVLYMTIDGIMVHEEDPNIVTPPPVVTPGMDSTKDAPGTAPSDAIVLFDGKDLSNWTSTKGDETKWILKDGTMSPTEDSGMIRSKQEFGSCQLHVEWASPKEVHGDGQGRGNSGVFLMGKYEIQVLDSYENKTYFDGQAGALYGRHKPLVNACRKPGEWQSYDIIFHRPVFEGKEVKKPATFTVFHNGVLIHDHVKLSGGTDWRGPHAISEYEPHGDKGPIMFQDHGNPVVFRNVWIRELND